MARHTPNAPKIPRYIYIYHRTVLNGLCTAFVYITLHHAHGLGAATYMSIRLLASGDPVFARLIEQGGTGGLVTPNNEEGGHKDMSRVIYVNVFLAVKP